MGARKPRWHHRSKVEAGDVIEAASGLQRVVRSVGYLNRKKGRRFNSVTVTIKGCSWTGSCYTILDISQLNQFGYRKLRAHVSLRTALDRRIQREIDRIYSPDPKERWGKKEIGCCDVRGIA